MHVFHSFAAAFLFSSFVLAAGPQSTPQIYRVKDRNAPNHVSLAWMMKNFFDHEVSVSDAKTISDLLKRKRQKIELKTPLAFRKGQAVWVRCLAAKRDYQAKIDKVSLSPESDFEKATILMLVYEVSGKDNCQGLAIVSPFRMATPTWGERKITKSETTKVRRLEGFKDAKPVRGLLTQSGRMFALFERSDPKSVYGQQRITLFETIDGIVKKHGEIGSVTSVQFVPVLDLNGDGVPEFTYQFSDGIDARLCSLFPARDCQQVEF